MDEFDECMAFEVILMVYRVSDILREGEQADIPEGRRNELLSTYGFVLRHIHEGCPHARHRNPSLRRDDECGKHELIAWLEEYLSHIEDDCRGDLKKTAENPVCRHYFEKMDEYNAFRIEHAKTCDRHHDELEELIWRDELKALAETALTEVLNHRRHIKAAGEPKTSNREGEDE